ncbi:GspH/FimT family pseudopilin [Stenotrophomonas indicatrix]|uniref:GspH/FimT family pseudopilin n=1 Tax=Stenotrophomonas indicatrix TaxID=2045451 RepID=UPI0008AB43A0|nr:GspH/FimT family pseudopilin [Stenotrophomonas indicatrix]SET73487.1 type IV fimbrial biogenesis protein FimT [Stenotrophomonas indicatrix]
MSVSTSTVATSSGFTLLELMVTVAVLAILITVALPSFSAMIVGNRITAAGNDLMAGLQFARHEAIRRNAAVQVCASADGQACSEAGWQRWIVRTSSGAVLRTGEVPTSVTALPQGVFLRGVQFDTTGLFHGRGSQEQQGRLLLCSTRTDRRLQLEASSGIRMQLAADAPGSCA